MWYLIKKFKLIFYNECPSCSGTSWETKGGMGCDWAACKKCGFARGFDFITKEAA